MTLTTEQTAILERAKALVDANPNDHTNTMELVRGLLDILETGLIGIRCALKYAVANLHEAQADLTQAQTEAVTVVFWYQYQTVIDSLNVIIGDDDETPTAR